MDLVAGSRKCRWRKRDWGGIGDDIATCTRTESVAGDKMLLRGVFRSDQSWMSDSLLQKNESMTVKSVVAPSAL